MGKLNIEKNLRKKTNDKQIQTIFLKTTFVGYQIP